MLNAIYHTLQSIDYSIFHFINQTISNTALDTILLFMRNAYTWIPLYVIIVFYLVYKYKWAGITYILYIVIAFAMADLFAYQLLKPLFGRMRPCHSATLYVRLVADHCGGKFSFPSSHATNHAAIAFSIIFAKLFKNKYVNYAWAVWAIIISIAQVYVGVHYPSDVVAGFIIGIIIATINYKVILPILSNGMLRIRKRYGN
ncbi:MAG: phosphatase PAP2 family protein [Chitinophagales bacterium]